MTITMKDIAMLAGVSRQAVSSTLDGNNRSRVSPATREKILKLARQLNYVPNAAARSLNGGKTHAIGILSTNSSPFHSMLLSEVCQILTARGYYSLTGYYDYGTYCSSSALSEMVSRGVDGVIIMNSNERKALEVHQKVPYVYCSHHHTEFDIGIDNELTGYLGTTHLLDHGHRRVHYLQIMSRDPEAPSHFHLRLEGWRRAHSERGIAVDDEMIITLAELDGRGSRLVEALRRKKVTALYASNDYIGCKAMKCLFEYGIRVPEDIALIGCDGHSFTEFMPVSLATLIQPLHPIAEKCVDLLLERIEKTQLHVPPAFLKIPPRVLPGGSCGCVSRSAEQLYRINTMGSLEKDYLINFNKNIAEDCL